MITMKKMERIKMKLKITVFTLTFVIIASMFAFVSADSSGWFKYDIPDTDKIDGTALDASYLLDAPAGKHGFLTYTEDDNFFFEDNTSIRFWGIGLSDEDTIPEYEDAALLAKRFSQLGYNLVRFISMENEIFTGRKSTDGRVINEENMDRLCFFLNELKKRGIYYIFDLNAGYWYSEDDNVTDVENTPKSFGIYGYSNQNLINLQKKMIGKLFSYRNPYTGICLADDPAMVFMNLRNETSVITAASGDMTSDYYNNELKTFFNDYLKKKYKTDDALKKAWFHKYPYNSSVDMTLIEGESIEGDVGTVELPPFDKRRNDNFYIATIYTKPRQEESNKFLTDLQMNYFKDMTQYLRNNIGVRCLISGCTGYDNQTFTLLNFYSNNDMDLIESHLYKGHIYGSACILYENPSTGERQTSTGLKELPSSTLGTTSNTPGTSDTLSENGYFYVTHSITKNVLGKPHVLSEWNYAALNPYKSEGLLLMSAYGTMQNMNMVMYDWGLNTISSYSSDNMSINEQYSTYNQPNFISALPAASAIFLRRDAKEAQSGFYYERYKGSEPFDKDFQRDSPSAYSKIDSFVNLQTLSHMSALVGKTGMAFDDYMPYDDSKNSNDILYLTKKFNEEGKFVSITGDMSYDTNERIYKLNTAAAQATAGFISDKDIELDDVIFKINNEFATVYLTSVGNEDICKSNRLLLTTVGHQVNTDQEMTADGQYFVDGKIGNAPILVESITGSVTLKTTDAISVYALDNSGQHTQKIAVTTLPDGRKQFELVNGAMNYEIIRESVSGTKNEHISLGDLTVKPMFNDVSETDRTAVERACLIGIMDSVSETEFKPDSAVTRQDFIGAVVDALNIYTYSTQTRFTDVDSSNKKFKQIAIAARLGLLSVYAENKLLPDAAVTKDEMISILGNAVLASDRGADLVQKYNVQNYDSDEFKKVLIGEGYINENTAKNNTLTRAETAGIIYNIMWK